VARRAEVCLALLIAAAPAVAARAADSAEGFRFCAAPVPPSCAERDQAYADPGQAKACEQDIARFVASAFAYRACLQREIQRAVLETNATIDRFKCGAAAKRRCSEEDLRKSNRP
jgi:hypothetical protein